nr:immunoglobulin light chain junction region [Macaca mulatta]
DYYLCSYRSGSTFIF